MDKSIFRKSSDKAVIEEIAFILDQNNIHYEIIDNEKDFDPSFVTNVSKIDYQLLVFKDDFEVANESISNYFAKEVTVPEDYYLLDYSNEELEDILYKKDEWNEFDYEVAKKILKNRGKNINDEDLILLNKKRTLVLKNEYEKPKEVEHFIIIGYVFSVLGCILSLFWGILIFVSYAIAIAIIKLKKQLPNGERIYYFNQKDRKHGKNILYLSLAFTIFWTLLLIIKS